MVTSLRTAGNAAISAGLRSALLWGCLLMAVPPSLAAPKKENMVTPRLPQNARILFQGDSITDGGRWHSDDPNHIFGQSYAYLIAAQCGGHYPDKGWTFINRGISGNKVTDLAARWQADTIAEQPTVLSVLVGVNDTNAVMDGREESGAAITEYEATYDRLLEEAQAKLPNVQFVLCEPFILKLGRTQDRYERWTEEIKLRQAVVEKLAKKYHAPVVHFQKVFDDACKRAPADYWIWDGIHPTYAGHQLMADEWLRTINAFYEAKSR